MAKRQKVNKTQAVREYLDDHPKAMTGEITAALNKQGIKIKPSHVANIKSQLKKARAGRKSVKRAAAVEAAMPEVAASAKAGDVVTLAQIRRVAQTIKAVGGLERLNELLGLVKEIGGLKRFKDLLDAMSVTAGE
jgi:uncharacterized phage protein gp47/JayE